MSRRIVLPYLEVFWSTGPIMLTAAFRKYAWIYGTLRDNVRLIDENYGGAVIGHAAGRSWHGADGQALNYIADHAQVGILLSGVASVFTVLGVIYVVRRYHGKITTR